MEDMKKKKKNLFTSTSFEKQIIFVGNMKEMYET